MEFASRKPCEKLLSHNNNILFQLTAKDNKSNGYSVSLEECPIVSGYIQYIFNEIEISNVHLLFPFCFRKQMPLPHSDKQKYSSGILCK